ncbi:MAG TPA: hypothetical protein VGR00_08610 [Thermoanaerobaculia bacterium]|nr:hypothetical protein [Thermoanaerobaculia bacterium]
MSSSDAWRIGEIAEPFATRGSLRGRPATVRVEHGPRPRVLHATVEAPVDAPRDEFCLFRVDFDPQRILFVLAEDGFEATPRGRANREGILLVKGIAARDGDLPTARLQFFELKPFVNGGIVARVD